MRTLNPGKSFSGGLGAIAFPDALIATTTTSEVLFLDPLTGKATGSFNVTGTTATDVGAAAMGQDVYLGFNDARIRVYSRAGTLAQTLTTTSRRSRWAA